MTYFARKHGLGAEYIARAHGLGLDLFSSLTAIPVSTITSTVKTSAITPTSRPVISTTPTTSTITVKPGVAPPPRKGYVWVWTNASKTKGYWKRQTAREAATKTTAIVAKAGSTLVPTSPTLKTVAYTPKAVTAVASGPCKTDERLLLGRCIPSYLSQSAKCSGSSMYLDSRSGKCVKYVAPLIKTSAPKPAAPLPAPTPAPTPAPASAPASASSPIIVGGGGGVAYRPSGGPVAAQAQIDAQDEADDSFAAAQAEATTPKSNLLLLGVLGAGALGALWYFTRK